MQEAIALTWFTLTARLKNLRAGAACAGLGLFLLIVAAAWFRSGWVLACLPALMLTGIAFFLRDGWLVHRWGDRILAAWGESDLCLGILVKTFRDHPGPLKATLQAMIRLLPENPDFLVPAPAIIRAERILFWIHSSMQRARLERAAILNLALSIVPLLVWAAWRRETHLLPLALAPLALVPPTRALLVHLELERLRRRVRGLSRGDPVGESILKARLEARELPRLPARMQAAWLRAIGAEGEPATGNAQAGTVRI